MMDEKMEWERLKELEAHDLLENSLDFVLSIMGSHREGS